MSDQTARLALPLLQPGQAQKDLTHNEALARLDLMVQASVAGLGRDEPPSDPEPGQCWIVGTAPTGAWAENAGSVAGWTAGGWRFVAPVEGLAVWDADSGLPVRRISGEWVRGTLIGERLKIGGKQVVGARRPAIAAPAGGGVADAEARAAVAAILGALAAHGLIEG